MNRFQTFAGWLGEFSPRHKVLRTPVYLEDGAPTRLREFWDAVGWSDGVGFGGGTRPEQSFLRPTAEKSMLKWFSEPAVRERWGIARPAQAIEAIHARLPAQGRYATALARGASGARSAE